LYVIWHKCQLAYVIRHEKFVTRRSVGHKLAARELPRTPELRRREDLLGCFNYWAPGAQAAEIEYLRSESDRLPAESDPPGEETDQRAWRRLTPTREAPALMVDDAPAGSRQRDRD